MITLKELSGIINLDAESSSDSRVKIIGMVRARVTAFGIAIENPKSLHYGMNKAFKTK